MPLFQKVGLLLLFELFFRKELRDCKELERYLVPCRELFVKHLLLCHTHQELSKELRSGAVLQNHPVRVQEACFL